MLLDDLPDSGWGVVRGEGVLIACYVLVGYVKAQIVYTTPDTYQVRLTAAGRKYRDQRRKDADRSSECS